MTFMGIFDSAGWMTLNQDFNTQGLDVEKIPFLDLLKVLKILKVQIV